MKKLLGLALGVTLLASGGSAFAQLQAGSTAGGSDVFVFVDDITKSTEFVMAIGVTSDTTLPTLGSYVSAPTAASYSFVAPTSSQQAALVSFLTSTVASGDSVQWGVRGGDTAIVAANGTPAIITSSSSALTSSLTNSQLSTAATNLNTVVSAINSHMTLTSGSPGSGASYAYSGSSDWSSQWAGTMTTSFDTLTKTAGVIATSTDNLYAMLSTTAGRSAASDLFVYNQVSLGATGLSFVSAPVPLPAAAWLLGSGLLGLVGIGRRRRA